MSEWNEQDSSTYRMLSGVAVPRRDEQIAAICAVIPFTASASFKVLELGCGEGLFAEALLERFSHATLVALDGSASMRDATHARTGRFGSRVQVRGFDLASLDWWDLMFGVDVVVSSMCLHHLNDNKKRYLFKAAAERLTARGALLLADLVVPVTESASRYAANEWDKAARAQAAALGTPERAEAFVERGWNHFRSPDPDDRPAALFHQLMWLKHAGFAHVDCFWMYAGHAVFGGFK